MRKKNIYVDEIGNVIFIKKPKVKNINIRLYPDGKTRTTLPVYTSYYQAVKVVKKKLPWILKQKEKLKNKKQEQQIIINRDTSLPYLKHKIQFVRSDNSKMKFEIFNGTLRFFFPEGINIECRSAQDFIRNGITEALRIEAKNFLPMRVKELAGEYGFSYRKVFIKNARTLWGSCSSKNNINLNLNLMRLPQRLQDYVILHELTHTRYRNHGVKFWKQLDNYFGDARTLSKELKKQGIGEL